MRDEALENLECLVDKVNGQQTMLGRHAATLASIYSSILFGSLMREGMVVIFCISLELKAPIESSDPLACLVLLKVLNQLFRLCESPEFLTPQAPAIQVLNCVRVLTRVLPFVFESEDLLDWEDRYFWTPRTVVSTENHHSSTDQSSASTASLVCTNSEIQPAPLSENCESDVPPSLVKEEVCD